MINPVSSCLKFCSDPGWKKKLSEGGRIIGIGWSSVCCAPKLGSLDNQQIQQLPAVTGACG